MLTVLISVLIVAVTGLLLGGIIGLVAKYFPIETDPRQEEILKLLPGANCGGCGYAGCADFAEAVVQHEADPDRCRVSSAKTLSAICAILGQDAGEQQRKVAVVLCHGDADKALHIGQYNGIMDCSSAALVPGNAGKACHFGCLGYGSCAKACAFGAIEIRNRIAVVHSELCTGCGKCTQICPRNLIRLVPADVRVHVYCNSLEKPANRRKLCKVSCLACRKCIRTDERTMLIQQGLVRVNYNNPPAPEFVEKVGCPTGALMVDPVSGHAYVNLGNDKGAK